MVPWMDLYRVAAETRLKAEDVTRGNEGGSEVEGDRVEEGMHCV